MSKLKIPEGIQHESSARATISVAMRLCTLGKLGEYLDKHPEHSRSSAIDKLVSDGLSLENEMTEPDQEPAQADVPEEQPEV